MMQIFSDLKVLSTCSFSTENLPKECIIDKRTPEISLNRLIYNNKQSFDFLGITPHIVQDGYKFSLQLETSGIAGVAPFFSYHGIAISDINVAGRFGENIEPILSLIEGSLRPEYSENLQITTDCKLHQPIFMECCKYIDKYVEAQRYKWQKFSNVIKTERQPRGSTLWSEYALRTAINPIESNLFTNKCNIISTDHPEWQQLGKVLHIAMDKLSSYQAPTKLRVAYSQKIERLRQMVVNDGIKSVPEIHLRPSDPKVISELKQLAINILRSNTAVRMAWRIDYAEFFERYVQYIFSNVARLKGADCHCNTHFSVSGAYRPRWSLAYLEPDIVLQKDGVQCVIDAKYKSHLLNINDFSNELKETFRHDLHQVLAYTSFSTQPTKCAMLVYPSADEIITHKLNIYSSLQHAQADIWLIGIPIDYKKIKEIKKNLAGILRLGESL